MAGDPDGFKLYIFCGISRRCTSSQVIRFADQSHGLAKLQIADELGKQEFDLHCDGTSCSNKNLVVMQVTLKNKTTLSMGFDPVAHETAQTLLDLAINKLTKFAVLNSPQDSAKELERMLGNVVGFMSDRANTMKCVGRLLNKHITAALQKEIQIQFLHCNAHFLLGLRLQRTWDWRAVWEETIYLCSRFSHALLSLLCADIFAWAAI